MTKEELINDGWEHREAMIGTLYLKGEFFCRLKDDVAIVYSVYNDRVKIGEAKTHQDMLVTQKLYDIQKIATMMAELNYMEESFKKKYNESPLEFLKNNENDTQNDKEI